jgi:hypothetical protein
MRVDTKDLVQTFQSNGDALEDFVHDLVRQVGRSCGIDPVNIHWDYRTYVRDGGRDLVVNVPNSRADKFRKLLEPGRRPLFAAKKGKDLNAMNRLPPIAISVPDNGNFVTAAWQPPEAPADAATDDLADVHANFRGWMNQQYRRAKKTWRYDPAFSSSGVKRLLRLAYVASLYTDELRCLA